MRRCLNHYIDGRWVESAGGRIVNVINPATEQPATELILGTSADVDLAVAAARRAFAAFSRSAVAERAALLSRIIQAYQDRAEDLARALGDEMGAPIGFALAAQVPAGLGYLVGTLTALDTFEFVKAIEGARIVHEPVGVVAMITPWNWPLNQICAKIAPAIAAGNTMILKPSEEAPSCSVILAEILEAAGTPPGVFNLVHGDGAGVGMALSAHPGIDMISITGSTRAGIEVARSAAATVKRVHQELGGKAPNVVLPGARLAEVLPLTVQGVMANTGQSCIAPTRILVHEDQRDDAVAVLEAIVGATRTGSPQVMGNHIGPVVNEAQFNKIQDLIRATLTEGARLVVGGEGRAEGHDIGYYVRPTLFADVTPGMRIWREESFGPIATLTTYRTLDEAIRLANDTDYGLSAVISGDPLVAADLATKLRAGLVTVNSWPNVIGAPFGGYGRSGNGREGGPFGIADFSEVKTIVG